MQNATQKTIFKLKTFSIMTRTFNFKAAQAGDTYTTIEGLTLTITNKVSAHTLYKGSQAYVEYTIEGIEGTHKATSSRLCEICGLTNDTGTTYKSSTTGSRIKIMTEDAIAAKVSGQRQKIEGAIKTLRAAGVVSHLAAVETEADYVLNELHDTLTAQAIAAKAEQDAKAAAAAQAAADKAMAAIKALSPEQMNALIAALAK
jgi:hypothetical protein